MSMQVSQALQMASVGQSVEDHDPVFGMILDPIMHEVCADESGAAGDEQSTQLSLS